jgi:hypothetical protein
MSNTSAFTQKLYIDYTRHNGLYEYNSMAMASWVHLTIKKNLKPEEAFAILNFTMAPFYIIADNLE